MSLPSSPHVVAALPGAYAHELVRLVGRWGVAPEALLAGFDVSVAELADPATRISLATCAALIERAHRLTGEPALALHMGMQMRLSSHGFLGFAAMTASNVREALALAERFSLTRTTAFALRTYVEGDAASLVLEERAPLDAIREFLVLTLFVGIAQIGEAVTGKRLRGVAECTFAKPAYLARFERALTGSVRFGRPVNRLVVRAAVLDEPIVTADPVAMQLARAQCELQLAALTDAGDFVGQVRAMTVTPAGFRPLRDVARRVHLSTRTLKRKLAEHGTTFSRMLDALRQQRALLLLEHRDQSIAEIAARLGYSDVANFTRAFKRWTGKTPAAFRTASDG